MAGRVWGVVLPFLALVGCVSLPPPVALTPTSRQFDLICEGKNHDAGGKTRPFSSRMSVDLDLKRFCLGGCWRLTSASETSIAYHYDVDIADSDHLAHSYRAFSGSSAGPFDLHEDITVNLRTGLFQRLNVYDYGDIASEHHEVHSAGRCALAPFTKLSPR